MILDPDQIHYICIARGTTVLAEFNSKDASLGAIAAKCLENTPPFHATFTHTVRSKTYTFLIDGPFVYFLIFDEKLENTEGLAFLKSVRDAFAMVLKGEPKLEKLSSHCFQGELNPVFRQLLGPALYHLDGIGSPTGQRSGSGSGSGPIRERSKPDSEKGMKRMKNRFLGRFNFSFGEDEFAVIGRKSKGLYSGELTPKQKARIVWKKQVWVVVSLDLIFCSILFAVWLWVCSGFQCMAN